jgi:response regulator NasT
MDAMRVLVAEDEDVIRENLIVQLTELGHTVIGAAENGKLAVEIALRERPDVVILDIRMPLMDGLEAAREIAAKTPCMIVFLTGFSEHAFAEQAGELGAVAYLMKPFRKTDLAPTLEVALKRYQQIEALSKEVDSLKENIEARKIIEKAKGILMKRDGLTEDQAFKQIHFQARNENRKMREIAETILGIG